jgi:hypothetical protein
LVREPNGTLQAEIMTIILIKCVVDHDKGVWINKLGNINGMIYFCPSQLKLNYETITE